MQITPRRAAVSPVKGNPGESKMNVMPAHFFVNLGTYQVVHTVVSHASDFRANINFKGKLRISS